MKNKILKLIDYLIISVILLYVLHGPVFRSIYCVLTDKGCYQHIVYSSLDSVVYSFCLCYFFISKSLSVFFQKHKFKLIVLLEFIFCYLHFFYDTLKYDTDFFLIEDFLWCFCFNSIPVLTISLLFNDIINNKNKKYLRKGIFIVLILFLSIFYGYNSDISIHIYDHYNGPKFRFLDLDENLNIRH